MHQNRFRLGLHTRPRWGSLRRSTDPLVGLEGIGASILLPSVLASVLPYHPWRRLCLRLLCKLHKIWSVDSQDNH